MMKSQEEIKLDAVLWFDLIEALQAFIVLNNHVTNAKDVGSHWTTDTILKLQKKLSELINEAPELLGEVAEDSDVVFCRKDNAMVTAFSTDITEEEIELYRQNGYADIEGNIRIFYGTTYAWRPQR